MTEGAREQDRALGGTNFRAASWLAWSLAGLSVGMFVAGVALYVLALFAHVPGGPGDSRTAIDALTSVPVLAFPVVGALIASRRRRNPIGLICASLTASCGRSSP